LSKKLSNKLLKFFYIQKFIDKQTYHFNLSVIYKVHSVFHVSLLESYNRRLNNDSIFKYLMLKLIDDKQEWKVEKILQKWKQKKILYYKIQWKEYLMKYNQWVIEWRYERSFEATRSFWNKAKTWANNIVTHCQAWKHEQRKRSFINSCFNRELSHRLIIQLNKYQKQKQNEHAT